MMQRMQTVVLASLLAGSLALPALPALAQMGGGMGGGGGIGGGGGHGGGRGGRGGGGQAPSTSSKPTKGVADPAEKPVSGIEIVGVITAIDKATSRVTIAYEPVEELNWPKGTMPFPVAKDALLEGRKVGDKVRFKVESHEIYALDPFEARQDAPGRGS
jgi:Cu/Ag efflux protein CusF